MSRIVAGLAVLALLACPSLWAQAVISAHSGMVNYVQGDVQLADQPVKLNGAIFPDVKVGQTLSTTVGHAEVLLTPGVFLRLDNHTSFKMISNKLTDTQVEILKGSVLVEADEILKDNHIAVKMGESATVLLKTGLYHFNADAGQIRAFQGQAEVSAESKSTELKGGRTLLVGTSLTPDKFNKKKSKDELYAWSQQRDMLLEQANISAARSLNSGTLISSLWAWSPGMNMYTFLPRAGRIYSPFGMNWYSPATVWIVFDNRGYQGDAFSGNSSWQGVSPSSAPSSIGPSSNASSGAVGASSGSSSGAVAASAGASRGR
jgi:hypothetical protein